MSNQPLDPYEYLQIFRNPDGTFTRRLNFRVPNTPASSDPTLPVLSKDLIINQTNNTWLRLFLPQTQLSSSNHKLPLIVYFHGSGFVVTSAASTLFHHFCIQMSSTVSAVVASVEYRLAPEHRLPAAFEDAVEALQWIATSDDQWLTQYADYSECYLMGSSAGATIAYHAGLRVCEEVNDLKPLKIQGLILHQPFFGGTQRTESELRLENNPTIPLCAADLMWELALPIGADRDHEYCTVAAGAGKGYERLDKMRELGWRVLVSGNGGDPLVDRAKELVQIMEEKGVQVLKNFEEERNHGVEFSEPLKAKQLNALVKHFIYMLPMET